MSTDWPAVQTKTFLNLLESTKSNVGAIGVEGNLASATRSSCEYALVSN